jgi:hypothetical protein
MDYSKHYLAFVLDDQTRTTIQRNWPPQFPANIRTHHVTVVYDGLTEELYNQIVSEYGSDPAFKMYGWYVGDGIDLFRVFRNDRDTRPDGGRFHLTHSFREGRLSSDSNRLFNNEIALVAHYSASLVLKGQLQLIEK